MREKCPCTPCLMIFGLLPVCLWFILIFIVPNQEYVIYATQWTHATCKIENVSVVDTYACNCKVKNCVDITNPQQCSNMTLCKLDHGGNCCVTRVVTCTSTRNNNSTDKVRVYVSGGRYPTCSVDQMCENLYCSKSACTDLSVDYVFKTRTKTGRDTHKIIDGNIKKYPLNKTQSCFTKNGEVVFSSPFLWSIILSCVPFLIWLCLGAELCIYSFKSKKPEPEFPPFPKELEYSSSSSDSYSYYSYSSD